MVNIGEILLTKFIDKLVDVGFDYLKDLHGWRTGMEAELQRLKDALPRIQAVVNAAEADPELLRINRNFREWLWQFKDAAYEADDVLDELDYLRLQKQVEEANAKDQERQNLEVRPSNSLIRAIKRLCKSDPTLEKLRAVVGKMDGIAAHVGDFLAIFNTVQQPHQLHQAQVVNDRETGSLLPEGSGGVVGRDTEREVLVRWLMKPSDEDGENSVPLFTVVGAGGMGKTTLSQSVFNDERVQKFFDLKIWVCVSTNFDARRLLAAAIESATKEEPKVKTIADLQIALKEKLVSSGKFLLVLDDAWNDDNRSGWDNFLAPLKWGKKGSKILLTTRSEGVAEMAALAATRGKKEVMKLAGFEDHVFIPLFYQYAFAGVKSADDYGKLQSIGKKIAKRLGGSPLAAKSIGALLNSKLDDQHWGNIQQRSSILDAQPAGQDNISSILMLSYHHLPAHLRSCFAYCSIFPQDYPIYKKILIRMWVGAGLIQRSPQNQSETDEDTGRNYFDDLLKRSFFEPHQSCRAYYAMHDLLHELAQSVSQDECFRAVDDTSIQGIPTMVRHLWVEIDNPNLLIRVDKWKNLRTLVLISKEYDHHEHSMIFSEVFKSLKSIRVLHLLVRGMIELPDEIGQLIHLRVLSDRLHEVPSLNIIQLPSLICKLYHLQYIYLPKRLSGSDGIPQGMNNLISLKRMIPEDIFDMIDGIGKLISLHELVFSIKDRSGRRIEELKDLNNLRELRIRGLENVKSHKEASMAELHNKGQLVNLYLEWGPSCSPDELVEHDEEIVDCLRPHSNLKELSITGYRGGRLAKWMEYEFVNNLEKIFLFDLPRLECLPCLGKLPYLKSLRLYKIPKVKQLDCEGGFPQLEELLIYGLDELEECSGLVENLSQWCPRLQKLEISDCPRLKVLPSLPLGLTRLTLNSVGLTTLPSFWPASNNDGSCSSSTESSSSSLSTVRITNCEQLTSLARGLLQPALEYLEISNCKELVDLPTEGLQHLSSLKTLIIKNCPKLQQALSIIPAVLPPSLRELRFGGFVDLGQIVAGSIHHLDFLSVSKCPKLVEATTAPSIKGESFKLTIDDLDVDDPFLLLTEPLRNLTSVQKLEIKDCSRLDTLDGQIGEWLLQNSVSLEYVSLHKAVSLQSLPPGIKDLSSLEYLELQGLDKLPSLPQLPLSLQTLELRGCNDTLKERCQKDDGADWPNIKHIPRIYINDQFITTDV